MFSKQVLAWRIERALAALKEQDIDLWISIGRETHLTTDPALMYMLPGTFIQMVALALTKTGQSICLCSPLHIEEVAQHGATQQNLAYRDYEDFDDQLREIIREAPKNGRIALNFSEGDTSADGLSLTQFRRLKRLFAQAGFSGEIVSSQLLMKRTRAQKNPEEVRRIGAAVDAALTLFDEFRSVLRPGMSGFDIQRWFQEKALERGYGIDYGRDGSPFCSIGARSSYYCVKPPLDVFVEPGDLVNVDLGIRLNEYASDNQRSYYVLRPGETEAPKELQRAFRAMQEAQQAVVRAMRPGIDTTVLGQAASDVFEKHGYPRVSGLGHELGAFAHEGGMGCGGIGFRVGLDTALEVGMTFTTEPAILTPYGRLCQEEVITVTPEGGHMHGVRQAELWLIKP